MHKMIKIQRFSSCSVHSLVVCIRRAGLSISKNSSVGGDAVSMSEVKGEWSD